MRGRCGRLGIGFLAAIAAETAKAIPVTTDRHSILHFVQSIETVACCAKIQQYSKRLLYVNSRTGAIQSKQRAQTEPEPYVC